MRIEICLFCSLLYPLVCINILEKMNKGGQVANAKGRQREEIIYSGKVEVFDPGFKWRKLFKPGNILREGCSFFIAHHLGLCYSLITLRCLS